MNNISNRIKRLENLKKAWKKRYLVPNERIENKLKQLKERLNND